MGELVRRCRGTRSGRVPAVPTTQYGLVRLPSALRARPSRLCVMTCHVRVCAPPHSKQGSRNRSCHLIFGPRLRPLAVSQCIGKLRIHMDGTPFGMEARESICHVKVCESTLWVCSSDVGVARGEPLYPLHWILAKAGFAFCR